MTTLVIDASVVVHWLTRGSLRPAAMAILDLYADQRVELIAPRQIVDEVGSALAKLHRRRMLSAKQALEAFRKFEQRRPLLFNTAGWARKAFALSIEHQTSYWDSLYMALAIQEKAELVTADSRLHRSISRHFPYVRLLG